jgi:F-type H+-transporting ATPase subunit gamma
MTSEQPLCGSFNPNVLAFAEQCLKKIRETGEAYVLVVGQRGARQLIAHGITPEAIEPAATSLDGLHDLVKRLARLLGTRYATGKLGALSVIYIRFQSISEQIPTETRLLPPDFSALRGASPQTPPRFQSYLSREKLLAGLVDEYVFISLYLIAAESYASEQASRLVAMDASTRNTEKMLDSLIDLERRERQSEITREVLELIAARFVDRS